MGHKNDQDSKNYKKKLASLKKMLRIRERQIADLQALIEVGSIITSTLEREKVLKNILDQTKNLMHCTKSSLLMVDETTGDLKFEVLTEEDDRTALKDVRLKMGEGIAGWVREKGKSQLISDAHKDIRFSSEADSKTAFTTKSLMAVPIIVDGVVIGVMEAINKCDDTCFSKYDLDLLEKLSSQAAIAIKNAQMYEMAITDGLTRLFIHRYFQKRLSEEFNRAQRYDHDLAIIMFDIDHFKRFNDNYGHQMGDEVLKKTAQVLAENCRSSDLPCRYGGEEMAVILPEADIEGALAFAEKMRTLIEEMELEFQGNKVQITVSGGVASLCANAPTSKAEFIQMADQALYYSKEMGRNCISCFQRETMENPTL